MTTITGTLRDGKVEFHGPTPPTWVEGTHLQIQADDVVDPDVSLEQWLKWLEEFQAMPRHAGDAEELEQILRESKQSQLQLLEAQRRRTEEMFS
jgi:hypothetical protein